MPLLPHIHLAKGGGATQRLKHRPKLLWLQRAAIVGVDEGKALQLGQGVEGCGRAGPGVRRQVECCCYSLRIRALLVAAESCAGRTHPPTLMHKPPPRTSRDSLMLLSGMCTGHSRPRLVSQPITLSAVSGGRLDSSLCASPIVFVLTSFKGKRRWQRFSSGGGRCGVGRCSRRRALRTTALLLIVVLQATLRLHWQLRSGTRVVGSCACQCQRRLGAAKYGS